MNRNFWDFASEHPFVVLTATAAAVGLGVAVLATGGAAIALPGGTKVVVGHAARQIATHGARAALLA